VPSAPRPVQGGRGAGVRPRRPPEAGVGSGAHGRTVAPGPVKGGGRRTPAAPGPVERNPQDGRGVDARPSGRRGDGGDGASGPSWGVGWGRGPDLPCPEAPRGVEGVGGGSAVSPRSGWEITQVRGRPLRGVPRAVASSGP